jgi:hypothetical protein
MGIFYNLSHYVPTFYPTQGYPLRFLALTHHICATSRMFPPKSHTNASLYMLLILQLRPPLCIIIPQHQSLIELNINKNTIACHDVAIGAMKIKTITTHFYKLFILHYLPHINPKTIYLLLHLQTPLLILVQPHLLIHSFTCLKCFWLVIPSTTNLFHITHKQQSFLLTTTNKQ